MKRKNALFSYSGQFSRKNAAMSAYSTPRHDRLAASLIPADDRVKLSAWLPPQSGTMPKIRIGQSWVSVLWVLPIVFLALVTGVALAQGLRETAAVQDFLARYPGAPKSVPAVAAGFPLWLRVQHFLNLWFMTFIIRAGIQVLADHPRADGSDGGRYYDVHAIADMRHALTLLAYEMNGTPVSVLHGAPLRLRCENQLGFKMVKWIAAIEFAHDFADLGAGQGGYNEDHEFYGNRTPI